MKREEIVKKFDLITKKLNKKGRSSEAKEMKKRISKNISNAVEIMKDYEGVLNE
jgi:hypothetical protein